MALVLADRVLETTGVTGTGDASLNGAITGYQGFSTVGDGNTTYYTIVAVDDNLVPTGDWEVGIGTYVAAGNKLQRTTVLSSSNAGALVYFASGTKQIFLDLPSEEVSFTGAITYKGTWNASTNTPTLTSSVGTQGDYYVVSVAGSTNLNGIIDWKVGDWAVFNGSVWEKIDNTDAVTSVNGYTGSVVLTYTDVGAFPATSTTGSGNVVLATGATQANPTISNYENFTPTTAPAYTEGRVWYDSTEKALAFYNDSSALAVHVSQDLIFKVINNTGSTIPNGSPVYITGTSSGQTYPNVALAKADVAATSAVIGLTNGAIANGAIGYVTSQGTIDNVNTSTFTVGQVLYLSPYSAGQLMNTIPPTGITVQVGVATYIDSSAGHIYVKQTTPLAVPASIIIGTLGVDHGGTGATTLTGYVKGSGTSALTSSSTIPTTDLSGTITNAQLANSSITINGSATSLGGSVSVGTVTSVSGTAPISSTGGATPAISISQATTSTNGYLSSTDWNTFNGKQPAGTYVTSVTGTAPVVSSGGTTPAISMAAANTSTNGYLTSTDWNTFNNKGSGTVTAVSVVSANGFAGSSSGGATPALTISTSITGVLKGNGTAISAATAGTDYVAPGGALGTPSSGTLTNCTFPTLNQNTTGSAATFTSTSQNSQFNSVGVGTAGSGTAGEIRATNNVTAYYSDARLKDFKGTIPNALAKVQALNGYYFTENAKAKELGYDNDKMQVGVSAQEVEAVLPEVVTEAPISAEYKTVYYDKLVPLLIEAIKELKAEVDLLKGK